MAGSSTPSKKLGIKPGHRVLLLNEPDEYRAVLGAPPENAELSTASDGTFDIVQVFVRDRADVDKLAQQAIEALEPGGRLWFSYPKQSSTVDTDINRDKGWDALSAAGLRPVTQISIDETWSALRFRPIDEVGQR